MNELVLRNRQRQRCLNAPLLRRIVRTVLSEVVAPRSHELCFHFVTPAEMAQVNEHYLNHTGPTDVITFDYSNLSLSSGAKKGAGENTPLQGEVFVCVAEAIRQSREFRTSWQSELVRYVVHGILHLLGHDDRRATARKVMKREENRIVRDLASRFPFSKLEQRRTRA